MSNETFSVLLEQIKELHAELKEAKKEIAQFHQRVDSLDERANRLQRFAILNPNVVKRSIFIFIHSMFGYLVITLAVGLVYLIVIGIAIVFAVSSNQPAPILAPTAAIVAPTVQPGPTFYRSSTPDATALTFHMRLTSAASRAETSDPTSTKRANVIYPTATPRVGRVIINNRLDIGLRFTFWGVSERSVDVAPGQTSVLELPPGTYGWTSIFLNDPRQCQLSPAENLELSGTFTITVIPAQNDCGADIQYGRKQKAPLIAG